MSSLGNKEVFAKNLNRYLKINGYDRKTVASKLDIKYTTFCDWCNAVYYPRIDKIELLANFFGINKSDLIEEQPADKNVRLASMEKNVVRVPLLGKIPAGMPFEAIEDEYTVDFEEVPADWIKGDKQYFALKITGDSMAPAYNDGDIVVFLKTPIFYSGQDCCVQINGSDATFKRVTIREDGIVLSPLNMENSSNFLPKFYSRKEIETLPVEILGVAKKLVKYL